MNAVTASEEIATGVPPVWLDTTQATPSTVSHPDVENVTVHPVAVVPSVTVPATLVPVIVGVPPPQEVRVGTALNCVAVSATPTDSGIQIPLLS